MILKHALIKLKIKKGVRIVFTLTNILQES